MKFQQLPLEEAANALSYIDPHDSDIWVKMAFALFTEYGDAAFPVWDEWSSTADNYDAGAARTRWKSVSRNDSGEGVKIATLIYEAKQAGYTPTKPKKISAEEAAAIAERRASANAALQEEREREQSEAAKLANDLWKSAKSAPGSHAYLSKKGLSYSDNSEVRYLSSVSLSDSDGKPFTLRDVLVLPIRKASKITSLQFIASDSRKSYLSLGEKRGGYLKLGSVKKDTPKIIICEGYATGVSLRDATDLPVIVAFDAPNIKQVAEAMRASLPDTQIIIAADNDRFTTKRDGTPYNPGTETANEAAKSISGLVAIPWFANIGDDKPTDFNDMALSEGHDEVRICIEEASDPAEPEPTEPEPTTYSETYSETVEPPKTEPKSSIQSLPARTQTDNIRELSSGERFSLWQQLGLDTKAEGTKVLCHLSNVVKCLELMPELAGLFWFDEFTQRIVTTFNSTEPREWIDEDDLKLMLFLQRTVGFMEIAKATVSDAVITVASMNKRNELKEWLDSLKWDGQQRLSSFMENAFGSPPSEYQKAASKNFWVSMIARVFAPGCKVDNMIVLEGGQGLKKSTILNAIAGKWFAEASEDISSKDFMMNLRGKLIVEIAEMDTFNKADVNTIKRVLSCRVDRFRAPYGRYSADYPRHGIFAGTCNRNDWNRDETGARRFWPIACKFANVDYVIANREQLFAEAVHLHKSGASWWEMPKEETEKEQLDRLQDDPWEPIITSWIIGKSKVTTTDILKDCLFIPTERLDRKSQLRVGFILRSQGWTMKAVWEGGRTLKVFTKAKS